MSSYNYITLPIETNPNALLQRVYDYLQARIPGWTPAEGNLDVWLAEAMSTETAELTDVASQVPDTIFRYFGSSLMGFAPIDATAATTTTTWTMRDNVGYTVPAGTQVGILDATGVLQAFVTINPVTVPPGQTVTATSAIQIVASVSGAAGTGLGGVNQPVQLIDILDFVSSITMAQATSGGVDAESDADYLNRLVSQLQLLALTPILPQDFAKLAMNVSPVYRATAIDGYNPLDSSSGNSRMVAVCVIDINGNPLAAPDKANVDAYLQSMREVNFVVNIMDPTYTNVDVTTQVHILPGYTAATVTGAVQSAIAGFLSPATWGQAISTGDSAPTSKSWVNTPVVRKYELGQIINGVPGVDYIITMTLGVHGGSLTEADLALAGKVPLPTAGTITVTSG